MTTGSVLLELMRKMESHDSDFRFMALNDLLKELSHPGWNIDRDIERRLVQSVLKALHDTQAGVQSIAVRCVGPLVRKISESNMNILINHLCNPTPGKNEASSDVLDLALKKVIMETRLGSEEGVRICHQIMPKLLVHLEDLSQPAETLIDRLDLLIECLSRFDKSIETYSLSSLKSMAIAMLDHHRQAIRKRATDVIGHLAKHADDKMFEELITLFVERLESAAKNAEEKRTIVVCVNAVSRNNPQKFAKYVDKVVPLIFKHANVENEELCEQCLQTLKSIVVHCPTAAKPYFEQLVKLGVERVVYDPNYADDEEETDDMDIMDEEEEEEEEEEEDEEYDVYSDDDESSWKVRRSAAKMLTALISTRSEQLPYFYEHVAPVLIRRFNEREETVRIEVLQAFIRLLHETNFYRRGSSDNLVSPNDQLIQLVPRISRQLAKQMKGQQASTRYVEFMLLVELVRALNGQGFTEGHFALFVRPLAAALTSTKEHTQYLSLSQATTGTVSVLKIEALNFVQQLLRYAPLSVFSNQLNQLVGPLCTATNDSFYKVSAHAIHVCGKLLVMIMSDGELANANKEHIEQLYSAILEHSRTFDADQEVRERAIVALGSVCADPNNQIDPTAALEVLFERCNNEGTQVVALNALRSIASSKRTVGADIIKNAIWGKTMDIIKLTRASHRTTKLAAFECILSFGTHHPDCISEQYLAEIMVSCRPLISENDLQLLPLALNCVTMVANRSPSDDIKRNIQVILKESIPLITSPLVQGAALDALSKLYAASVKCGLISLSGVTSAIFEHMSRVDHLVNTETVEGTKKQIYNNVAQCLAACAATVPHERGQLIETLISQFKDSNGSKEIRCASLQVLGEIGRNSDLSSFQGLYETLLNLLANTHDEIRSTASFALGNVAAGNIQQYLPMLVHEIKQRNNQHYLLFNALKETVSCYSDKDGVSSVQAYADDIWSLLFEECNTEDETSKNVVAECIGRLTLSNPRKFLPELERRLDDTSARTRAAVISAIKFAFTGSQSKENDDLLRPLLDKLLLSLDDENLTVHSLALNTLNTAAHSKAYMMYDILDQLLPLLYKDTAVRPELIRTLDMGPYKHQVDDGLAIRKAAYECMFTLLDNCADRIEIPTFLDYVVRALNDRPEVRALTYLTLTRLIYISPTSVTQRLDDISEMLREVLNAKLKANATQQEIDRQREQVLAALRLLATLSPLAVPLVTPKFSALLQEIRAGPHAEDFRNAMAASKDREQSRLGAVLRSGDDMDLS